MSKIMHNNKKRLLGLDVLKHMSVYAKLFYRQVKHTIIPVRTLHGHQPLLMEVNGMSNIRNISEAFYDTWRIMSIFNRVTAEPNGAYSTQFRALLVLYNQKHCTQKKLAKTLGVKPSSCSALVNNLVELGLVKRVPNAQDRREVILMLTAEGERICYNEMTRRYSELDCKFSCLSDNDRDELIAAFQTVQQIQAKIPLEVEE